MIPINSKWEDKIQVKKGNYGEDLVNNYLNKKGYVIYTPITNNAHCFDRIVMKNKSDIKIVECKTKAKRTYFDDTGIDIRHYNEYKNISDKYIIPLFIFFIDEYLGEIYGNYLTELIKPKVVKNKEYPLEYKGIMYFPMVNMIRDILVLNENDKEYLKGNSTRNYEYNNFERGI